MDVIDLYQIHWPAIRTKTLEEGWSTLADLKREGKVRWIGVSNFNVRQMRGAQAIAPVTSLQPPYSLVPREIERRFCPTACAKESGSLFILRWFGPAHRSHDARTRRQAAQRRLAPNESRFYRAESLRAIWNWSTACERSPKRHNRSLGEVAIAWTLRNPAVTGAIVGARNARQVEGVMRAGDLRLNDKEVNEIEDFLAETAA